MPEQKTPPTVRNLGPKALDCLRLAEDVSPVEFIRLYAEACAKYSAKAVHRKLAELTRRGYLVYSACFLTERAGKPW